MSKLKKLLIGALALCMTVSATACGGGNNSKGGTNDFVLQIYTGGYGAEMWNYVIREFEKDHPEYNVIDRKSVV